MAQRDPLGRKPALGWVAKDYGPEGYWHQRLEFLKEGCCHSLIFVYMCDVCISYFYFYSLFPKNEAHQT